jgi:hypothetical protein
VIQDIHAKYLPDLTAEKVDRFIASMETSARTRDT